MSAQTIPAASPPTVVDSLSPIQLAPVVDWSALDRSEHFVQFYESDTVLERSVSEFVGAGLRQGGAAIVIGTEAHRHAIEQHLLCDGIELAAAQLSSDYFPLDAAETLAKFMVDGMPDSRLFNHVVGTLVARAVGGGRPVRAFGEMVALLWEQGKAEAAIQLEQLWNELGQRLSFCLFCAYPMAGFASEPTGQPFLHVCKAHTRVIPAESYSGSSSNDARLRTIAQLQQKAATLENEIARRKQIEKELAREKRELADFLQNATEGIHQVALDGTILWANRAELELLGYTAAEYIGHDIREFYPDTEVVADILERLARGETLHDYEARLRHKDGSIRCVSINSNVYWDEEQFRYSRCFTRDITDRKRAAEILEQTVAERTVQLQQTVDELEAFSYSLSHDMRSPLRAMQGHARAILLDHGQSLPSDIGASLHRIERAATRLDLLVRDVLAYSKVSRGQLRLQTVDLELLINDLLEEVPELQETGARVTIQKPLHLVVGHEAYLSQCFANLLSNAAKFVDPGAFPEIHIHSHDLGNRIHISVADNGIGIAPEHNDRIFKIFGRVHSEKKYPGTGIGLAIVKRAVERMGGAVGFESQPGKGSCFWFTLGKHNHGK